MGFGFNANDSGLGMGGNDSAAGLNRNEIGETGNCLRFVFFFRSISFNAYKWNWIDNDMFFNFFQWFAAKIRRSRIQECCRRIVRTICRYFNTSRHRPDQKRRQEHSWPWVNRGNLHYRRRKSLHSATWRSQSPKWQWCWWEFVFNKWYVFVFLCTVKMQNLFCIIYCGSSRDFIVVFKFFWKL